MSARFGVRIVQWGVPVNRAATADEVVEAIPQAPPARRHARDIFSSPMWPNGQRLPERRIAALAQEAGAITVADGAHYGGMIEPRLDETGIDFWAISGHKWQCGPGGTGILYIRNRLHPANPTPLPRFHIIRSSLVDMPHDGSRPADFDIGAAMSRVRFSGVCRLARAGRCLRGWDEVGRARIQAWTHNLADYLRQRIAAEFGDDALLQPAVDPALKSAIVCFNPFSDTSSARNPALNRLFRDRLLLEYAFRIAGGGVGPNGFTRAPDPQAAAFPDGLIPNRDPDTLAPAPFGFALRVNACVWNSVEQMDRFVAATRDLVRKMTTQ